MPHILDSSFHEVEGDEILPFRFVLVPQGPFRVSPRRGRHVDGTHSEWFMCMGCDMASHTEYRVCLMNFSIEHINILRNCLGLSNSLLSLPILQSLV